LVPWNRFAHGNDVLLADARQDLDDFSYSFICLRKIFVALAVAIGTAAEVRTIASAGSVDIHCS
jgi:hypothetical protein